jgi:Cytochrome c554 and c-prime
MSWSTLSGMAKWVVLAAGLIAGQAWSADAVLLPNLSHEQTVGSVSCASSLCHGATVAWQGGHVLQNEYTTWSRLDQHTRTYAVLLNDKSKEIAQKLGLEKPAHQSKVCLDCHAHNPPQELRGERFVQSEGVGCEACHGPIRLKGRVTLPISRAASTQPINRLLRQSSVCPVITVINRVMLPIA